MTEKLKLLKQTLLDMESVAVAYSGGIDSTLLLKVAYDCLGGGGTRYAKTGFNCTAFLDRLDGGPGKGKYVNCTDCATIVSTFANIVGCELLQSRMGFFFDLNPILAIGQKNWYPGCPNWLGTGFRYHEVAWKSPCTLDEEVFDACLLVDGDADPTQAPQTPLLPVNMRFGEHSDKQYRYRLEKLDSSDPNHVPTDQDSTCEPQPPGGTRSVY